MMPSSTSIPHLNITFDGTQDEGAVRQLLRHLFPGISHQPFSIEVLDGGLSNQLLLVRFAIESPDFPRLLIRIYNQTANCLVDRALELSCMLNLSKFRGTPVIYALLNNGISYSYVTGFTIPLHYLSMEKYARMMASELARFHSLPSEDVSVQPLQSNGPRCTESRLFRRLRNWISKLPAEFPDKEVTEKFLILPGVFGPSFELLTTIVDSIFFPMLSYESTNIYASNGYWLPPSQTDLCRPISSAMTKQPMGARSEPTFSVSTVIHLLLLLAVPPF
ncbi:unnamed protein product [Dicrocoelium dendriticum]|nr:unnamed protein product [Dicrocoelium dendriticum]